MSILEKLGGFLGGGLGGKIADIIGSKIANKAEAEAAIRDIEKAIGERAHQLAMAEIQQETDIAKGQAEVNKIEAGSDSLFKSGWRPAIGWICGAALFYQMLLRPLLAYSLQKFLEMPPPPLEIDTLLTLLFGILGLGAFRSYDKAKGTA